MPPQCGWGRMAFGSSREPHSTHNPPAGVGPPDTGGSRGAGRSSSIHGPGARARAGDSAGPDRECRIMRLNARGCAPPGPASPGPAACARAAGRCRCAACIDLNAPVAAAGRGARMVCYMAHIIITQLNSAQLNVSATGVPGLIARAIMIHIFVEFNRRVASGRNPTRFYMH